MDILKELKAAVAHRIKCIPKPYINGFAGTGRSRKRTAGSVHSIAHLIMDRTFEPFAFHWNTESGERAETNDIYLTVFTALFDIDDEDAARWSSRTEWDAAQHEAAHDIARALMRKFTVTKRRLAVNIESAGSHNTMTSQWVDDEARS